MVAMVVIIMENNSKIISTDEVVTRKMNTPRQYLEEDYFISIQNVFKPCSIRCKN